MGFFDFIFTKGKKSLQDADDINKEYIKNNPTPADNESERLRQASSLMTGGSFAEAMEAYKRMAADFPAKRGLYESQVGVGYFFMGDYTSAIKHYLIALENGMNQQMIDDNIWEAAEILYKENSDKSALELYVKTFPKGQYISHAIRILDNR